MSFSAELARHRLGTSTSAALLVAAVACVAPTPVSSEPVATVIVSPAAVNLQGGQTAQLTVTLQDAAGHTLVGRAVNWASTDAAVATVSSSGLVAAAATGSASIWATSEGVSGSSGVTVAAAGSAQTIFSDDFESGALGDAGRWQDIVGNGFAIVTAASEGITAPSGTRVMRIQPTGGAITHFVATGAISPHERLRLAYSMYRKAGYASGGLRSGLIRGSRDQWGSFGIGQNCPDDPNNKNKQEFFVAAMHQPSGTNWQLRMYNYWLGQQKQQEDPPVCYGTYALGPNDDPQGTYHDLTFAPVEERWYRYEIELQLNTPGQADGWEKVWVDGILKIEHRNVKYRNDPATRIWAVSFDVGSTTVGTAYVDDVLVTVATVP